MTLAAARTGKYLATLPDGETGDRADWVTTQLPLRGTHPGLITVRRSRMHRSPLNPFIHTPLYLVRPGQTLSADWLDLGYAAAARSAPILADLATRHTLAGVRLQVGIPGPLDMAVFSWVNPLRQYQIEADAALREVEAIEAFTGRTAVHQVEIPVETYLVAKAPRRARGKIAARLARRVTEFIARVPAGSTWIVHLGVGDPHAMPLVTLRDTAALVELGNALGSQWPAGRTFDALHLPLGDGTHPAPLRAGYYAPLADLALPPTVHVSAGLAHADADLEDQLPTLAAAEKAAGHQLGGVEPVRVGPATAGGARGDGPAGRPGRRHMTRKVDDGAEVVPAVRGDVHPGTPAVR